MTRKLYENDGTPRAIAIVGPTASGKTALSLALGEALPSEIVCCDSMQIYRGMDIGTAKPTAEERARLPHHMVDFLSPDTPYSAADYAEDAMRALSGILSRGRVPILVGGTGLYLEALRTGRHEGLPPVPAALREELMKRAGEEGAEALYRELASVDPASSAAIHPNNVKRVLRALEIYYTTGRKKSELDAERAGGSPRVSLLVFGLFPTDRTVLHDRIDRRVDAMVGEGLRREVEALLAAGYLGESTTAGAAIGYKEYAEAIRGEISEEEAIRRIKVATHRYARRQLTWFRAIPDIVPIPTGEGGVSGEEKVKALSLATEFLAK